MSFTREKDGDDISRNATNAAAVAADVTKMADDDDGGGGGGQDGATAQIVKISDL